MKSDNNNSLFDHRRQIKDIFHKTARDYTLEYAEQVDFTTQYNCCTTNLKKAYDGDKIISNLLKDLPELRFTNSDAKILQKIKDVTQSGPLFGYLFVLFVLLFSFFAFKSSNKNKKLFEQNKDLIHSRYNILNNMIINNS